MIGAFRNCWKLCRALGYTLSPCDERLGVEGSLHIIAIFAAGSTILGSITLGRIEPVYAIHAYFEIQPSTIYTR